MRKSEHSKNAEEYEKRIRKMFEIFVWHERIENER